MLLTEPFNCADEGWLWSDVASDLSPLAPSMARRFYWPLRPGLYLQSLRSVTCRKTRIRVVYTNRSRIAGYCGMESPTSPQVEAALVGDPWHASAHHIKKERSLLTAGS